MRQSYDFGRRLNGENRCRKNICCPLHEVQCSQFEVGIFFNFRSFFVLFRFGFVMRCECLSFFVSLWYTYHITHTSLLHCICWSVGCKLCTCSWKLNLLNDQTHQKDITTTTIMFYSWTIFKNFNVPLWFRFYYSKTDSMRVISEIMNQYVFFCYCFFSALLSIFISWMLYFLYSHSFSHVVLYRALHAV